MTQYGHSKRDLFNVNGPVTINNHGAPTSETPPPEPAPPSSKTIAKALGAAVFAVVVVVCLIASLNSEKPKPPPDTLPPSQPWPAELEDRTVVDAVMKALNSCAQEVVLEPLACPQYFKPVPYPPPIKVSWTVEAGPADGLRISFHDGVFDVLGRAVMRVSYESDGRSHHGYDITPFRTEIAMTDGQFTVNHIRRLDAEPVPALDEKTDPGTKTAVLFPAVREAFAACLNSRKAPMPPGCPQGQDVGNGGATCVLEGDPLANATRSFDTRTGLLHVKGNYSIYCTYNVFLFGKQTAPYSGTYDAVIAATNMRPVVLEIAAL